MNPPWDASDAGRATILIADDQPDVIEALRLLLKGEGYRVEAARSPAGVLAALDVRDFDAVVMDLNYTRDTTSGREGLDLLQQVQALDWTLPVLVMTAWGSVDSAVEAMRRGAYDYVEKPWDNQRLLATLRNQVEMGRALRRSQRLESENEVLRAERTSGLPAMIAESPRMRPLLDMMRRVAPSDANVLITGEHGTGKELVAQWIHSASTRAARPFVTVNMGGLSEGVFESELFGHVKGAFTDARTDRIGRFELAEGGTIFLDEIANVPLPQQAKLLRVLQTGEMERVGSSRTRRVNARVISATNADPQAEVAAGNFREDLLFRLNTIELHIPPLRERREDVMPLAMHFLHVHAGRYDRSLTGFDQATTQALLDHPWPGNIRELGHAVERAVLLSQGKLVRVSDLGLRGSSSGLQRPEEMTLEEMERMMIQKALARFDGNVSQAARVLGLSRSALYRRLEAHNL